MVGAEGEAGDRLAGEDGREAVGWLEDRSEEGGGGGFGGHHVWVEVGWLVEGGGWGEVRIEGVMPYLRGGDG